MTSASALYLDRVLLASARNGVTFVTFQAGAEPREIVNFVNFHSVEPRA